MSADPRRSHLTSETLARGIARQIWKEFSARSRRYLRPKAITRAPLFWRVRDYRGWQKMMSRLEKQANEANSNLAIIYTGVDPTGKFALVGFFAIDVDDRLSTVFAYLPTPKHPDFASRWAETSSGPVITRHAIERLIQRARIQSTEELRGLLWLFLGVYLNVYIDNGHDALVEFAKRKEFLVQVWYEQLETMIEFRIGRGDGFFFLATVVVDGVPIWEIEDDNDKT
jgi:hypothetical protein